MSWNRTIVYLYKKIFRNSNACVYLVRPMPRSSLCKGSDGIRSPKSKDKFSGRVALSPLDDLVQTIFPVSIVVSTGSLVEVEVDQVVVGQCFLLDEIIHCIKTLHLYVFEITLGCNPCSPKVFTRIYLFVKRKISPDL